MHSREIEEHPIFAAFTAAALDQLLDEEYQGICVESVKLGRPLDPAAFSLE